MQLPRSRLPHIIDRVEFKKNTVYGLFYIYSFECIYSYEFVHHKDILILSFHLLLLFKTGPHNLCRTVVHGSAPPAHLSPTFQVGNTGSLSSPPSVYKSHHISMMGACENMCETPLRDLNGGRLRLNRLEVAHPREVAYSPDLAKQACYHHHLIGRLQPRLAKQTYYCHHLHVSTSRTPETTPTAQVGQTGVLSPPSSSMSAAAASQVP
jgi:hypothetical protein